MKHKTNGNVSQTTEQKPTHRTSGKGCKNPTKMTTEMAKSKYPVVPYFLAFIFGKTLFFIFQRQLFKTLFYKNGQGGGFSKTLLIILEKPIAIC